MAWRRSKLASEVPVRTSGNRRKPTGTLSGYLPQQVRRVWRSSGVSGADVSVWASHASLPLKSREKNRHLQDVSHTEAALRVSKAAWDTVCPGRLQAFHQIPGSPFPPVQNATNACLLLPYVCSVDTCAKRTVAGWVSVRRSMARTLHLTQVFQEKYIRTSLSRKMFIKQKQNMYWNALNSHKSQLKTLHVAGERPIKDCIVSK